MRTEITPAMPAPVQVFEDEIGGVRQPCVNARELWQVLGSRQNFSHWVRNRVTRSRLRENRDWRLLDKPIQQNGIRHGRGLGRLRDYLVTLDAAKFIGMMEDTPAADALRLYFLECERRLFADQAGAPDADATARLARLEDINRRLQRRVINGRPLFRQIKHYRAKDLAPHEVALLCGLRMRTLCKHLRTLTELDIVTPAYLDLAERIADEEAGHDERATAAGLHRAYLRATKANGTVGQMLLGLDAEPESESHEAPDMSQPTRTAEANQIELWWNTSGATRYPCVWADDLIAAVPQLRGKIGHGRKWVCKGPAPATSRRRVTRQDALSALEQQSEWRHFCTLKAAFTQLRLVQSEKARTVERHLMDGARAMKGAARPRSGSPASVKPATPAALALPSDFAEALSIIIPAGRWHGPAHIGARRLHGLFRSARQFTDWIEHRETQRIRRRPELPRLDAIRQQTKQASPNGGRRAFDFLLTPEQARFLADCDKSPAAGLVRQALDFLAALEALKAGVTPDDAFCRAGAFPVHEWYSVRELALLFGEADGYPRTEFGWRKRLEREGRYGASEGGRYRLTVGEIEAVRRRVLTATAEHPAALLCEQA